MHRGILTDEENAMSHPTRKLVYWLVGDNILPQEDMTRGDSLPFRDERELPLFHPLLFPVGYESLVTSGELKGTDYDPLRRRH